MTQVRVTQDGTMSGDTGMLTLKEGPGVDFQLSEGPFRDEAVLYISTAGGTSGIASTWFNGSGLPSDSLGIDGDYYLNDLNGDTYHKTSSHWNLTGNIEGPPGPGGPAGPTGGTGPTGSAGTTGAVGPAGPAGATGPSGPQGTQGTTGPQGSVGGAGPPGPSLLVKGTVATVGALPPTGNTPGDAYVVSADGHMYTWTGTAWVDAGPVQGPPGPQGIQGPGGTTGAAGTTGATGPAGPTGPSGSTGATGSTGAQGPKGDTGLTGAQGPQGAQGPAGPAGASGDPAVFDAVTEYGADNTGVRVTHNDINAAITAAHNQYVATGIMQTVQLISGTYLVDPLTGGTFQLANYKAILMKPGVILQLAPGALIKMVPTPHTTLVGAQTLSAAALVSPNDYLTVADTTGFPVPGSVKLEINRGTVQCSFTYSGKTSTRLTGITAFAGNAGVYADGSDCCWIANQAMIGTPNWAVDNGPYEIRGGCLDGQMPWPVEMNSFGIVTGCDSNFVIDDVEFKNLLGKSIQIYSADLTPGVAPNNFTLSRLYFHDCCANAVGMSASNGAYDFNIEDLEIKNSRVVGAEAIISQADATGGILQRGRFSRIRSYHWGTVHLVGRNMQLEDYIYVASSDEGIQAGLHISGNAINVNNYLCDTTECATGVSGIFVGSGNRPTYNLNISNTIIKRTQSSGGVVFSATTAPAEDITFTNVEVTGAITYSAVANFVVGTDATLNVGSTQGFPTSGQFELWQSATNRVTLAYTGITPTSLTGVSTTPLDGTTGGTVTVGSMVRCKLMNANAADFVLTNARNVKLVGCTTRTAGSGGSGIYMYSTCSKLQLIGHTGDRCHFNFLGPDVVITGGYFESQFAEQYLFQIGGNNILIAGARLRNNLGAGGNRTFLVNTNVTGFRAANSIIEHVNASTLITEQAGDDYSRVENNTLIGAVPLVVLVGANSRVVNNSGVAFTGPPPLPLAAKSANYTVTVSDGIITVDASAAARTITLPTAVSLAGQPFTIKKTDSSTNTVTVATTSSQTIDGATTYVVQNRYDSITVVSDGGNWVIV